MQLLDELPMIWTASILLYASLSRSVAHPTLFAVGLTVTTIGVTVFYLHVANPEILFHHFWDPSCCGVDREPPQETKYQLG